MQDRSDKEAATAPPKATVLQTFIAVAWSFFGVRSQKDTDSVDLDPRLVLAVAVFAALVLVLILLGVVDLIVNQ